MYWSATTTATETRYDAGTVLWTAGVEAPPVAEALAAATGAKRDRSGRILVEKNLTIPGHPEISVLGDMMSLDKLPGVAEVAMQSGLYAGHRIRHRVSGDVEEKPFRYHDLGSAAYISRGRAVVSAGPLKVGGFVGWVIWLFIHIAFLTGFRNRVGALLTWWLAFTRDIRRERTFTTQQIETLGDIYTRPLGPVRPAAVPPAVAAVSHPARPGRAAARPAGSPGQRPDKPQAGDDSSACGEPARCHHQPPARIDHAGERGHRDVRAG